MNGREYKSLQEAYNSIYEQPVIASSGSKLGVVDKKDGKVVPGSFRVPTDDDLGKVDIQKYKDSPAGQAFLQKKESDKALGAFKTPGAPGSKISTTSTAPSTPSAPTAPSAPKKSFQQELDDLRKASAQATMAGPSKEAQALMSDRAKRMLGADKLKAGIAGQERVQRMMKGVPEPTSAPKPTAPSGPTSTTAPTPKPATTVKPGDFGTTMGPGPTFKGGPVPPKLPNRNAIQPTDWGSIKSPTSTQQTQTPQAPKPPVPDRSKDYQRAWDNRNNPLAKGQIRNTWSKMSPEEKAAAKEWAQKNNKNWQEMGLPEQRDTYDQVLQILLDEGYSEQECNEIMVQLVNEGGLGDFFKAVQQRTGIGKPGVGPGQVARNVLKAGISDILGTSIATGSTPSSVSAAKPTPTTTSSPTPVVRTSTKPVRTAPKGANIAPDPWKQPTSPRSSRATNTPKPTTTSPKALTGSPTPRALSGSQTRAALPSGTRGGALAKATPGGAITPTAKPGALAKVQKPSTTPTTTTRALPGTSVRGLLPQGVRNVLPDPWKDASNVVSGTRNLWNRVQQAVKPQAQLKPSQTNVRGLLPAAKPSPQTAAKPATSVRSQQFRDVQRLNKMMKGGLMGELPSTKPSSKPAPRPTGNVDKLPPKPATTTKPSVKPKMPSGGSNLLQGLATLASLRNLTPAGVAAAVMAPRPTADGTLDAAMKRGDVAPPAPKLPAPQKPKAITSKPPTKPPTKPAAKPAATKPAKTKPVDPDLQRYQELRKKDPAKAKELGTKIWLKKYGAPTDGDIA